MCRGLSEAEHEERRAADRQLLHDAARQLLTSEGWKRWFECAHATDLRGNATIHPVRRLVVDLNFGGRLEDGRGITYLVRGERRNGDIPDDLQDGTEVLLADYDGFDDGGDAWIEIPARLVQEQDGWSAVWEWDARRWRPRR